jgi:hypothetical protein
MILSEERALSLGLKPLALSKADAAQEPNGYNKPIKGSSKALDKAGIAFKYGVFRI